MDNIKTITNIHDQLLIEKFCNQPDAKPFSTKGHCADWPYAIKYRRIDKIYGLHHYLYVSYEADRHAEYRMTISSPSMLLGVDNLYFPTPAAFNVCVERVHEAMADVGIFVSNEGLWVRGIDIDTNVWLGYQFDAYMLAAKELPVGDKVYKKRRYDGNDGNGVSNRSCHSKTGYMIYDKELRCRLKGCDAETIAMAEDVMRLGLRINGDSSMITTFGSKVIPLNSLYTDWFNRCALSATHRHLERIGIFKNSIVDTHYSHKKAIREVSKIRKGVYPDCERLDILRDYGRRRGERLRPLTPNQWKDLKKKSQDINRSLMWIRNHNDGPLNFYDKVYFSLLDILEGKSEYSIGA
ncbi:MAG: hypothetical protein H8E26_09115 [FCB group bacterium]|nr:hypothetical protein [FCB group bacterium]MBL7028960.1 hypothetical protein [Candidatus Neomarinimicrobiota bacterium]MBL7121980.1 hypothetical protein [Candidatus Neomarinimicrobiota bacterium]